MPLSSNWISIEGDLEDNHALISDFDFMLQLDQIGSSYAAGKDDLTIDTYGCQIGYAKLRINNNQSVQGVFRASDHENYLSARTLKNRIYQAIGDTDMSIYPGFVSYAGLLCVKNSKDHFVQLKLSGPAIKLEFGTGSFLRGRMITANFAFFSKVDTNKFLADITFSVPCKEWPSISDWPSRQNRCWPSAEDVRRIVNLGFHLVPKSQEQGDPSQTTWRFSFSQAEVELSKLISDDARKCLLALKIVLKDFLTYTCSKLSSYHLKTIYLHRLERTGLEFWSENDGGGCEYAFMVLLRDLKIALDSGECNHFWIPQINLFKDIHPHKLKSLSKVLDKVIQNPSPYIQQPEKKRANCCKIVGVNAPILIEDVGIDIPDYEEAVVITYATAEDVGTADQQRSASTLSGDTVLTTDLGTTDLGTTDQQISTCTTTTHLERSTSMSISGDASTADGVGQHLVESLTGNSNLDNKPQQQQQSSLGAKPSTSSHQTCPNGLSNEISTLQKKQQQEQQSLSNTKPHCTLTNHICPTQQQSLLSTKSSMGVSIKQDYGSFNETTTIVAIGNDNDIETQCQLDFNILPLPKPLREILF